LSLSRSLIHSVETSSMSAQSALRRMFASAKHKIKLTESEAEATVRPTVGESSTGGNEDLQSQTISTDLDDVPPEVSIAINT